MKLNRRFFNFYRDTVILLSFLSLHGNCERFFQVRMAERKNVESDIERLRKNITLSLRRLNDGRAVQGLHDVKSIMSMIETFQIR